MPSRDPLITATRVSAYTVPTHSPESDGTLEWNETTLILVELEAGGCTGLGYSYADASAARLVQDKLLPLVRGQHAMDIPAHWLRMVREIRNLGRPGICSMAISAVDNALWDLKARLLDLPLARLLGQARDGIAVYGSGGFTSYSIEELQHQLGEWAQAGLRMVKMKVGRHPEADVERVAAARVAIGPETDLFVDANGAYAAKQALQMAEAFVEFGVKWFEEPVSSDDLAGLRMLRHRAPAGMDISAGEYGYDPAYFRRMLEARAVDVLQADATRCAGITGFLGAAALCDAFAIPLSSHCAPALHLPLCCAVGRACHLEYFFDHLRIERMLFEGVREPRQGMLTPSDRPGLGLEFKYLDARRYAV